MALPILDGNQTSTTLSTTFSDGEHIPAHTIVSLGEQAIADIATAVGGSPVTITGGVYLSDAQVVLGGNAPAEAVQIGGYNLADNKLYPIAVDNNGVQSVSGTVTASAQSILDGLNLYASNYNDKMPVAADISSMPAISGTVTANGGNFVYAQDQDSTIENKGVLIGWRQDDTGEFRNVSNVQPLPISGTVTVGSLPVQLSTTTIGGTARLNVTLSSATTIGGTAPSYGNLYGGSDGTNLRAILVDSSGRTTVTGSVNILGTPSVTFSAIAGTVTANNPNGTLTTRFGSVVTANSVLATTCVTNASRKYLLVQNNQTGTSAGTVTIGIGFTPTTTQGIQLISGASYTADSFVPTGAVYWLGSVTGANFTILEG